MRNTLKIALFLLVSPYAFSNTIEISNTTDANMLVKINYLASDVCSPDIISIAPKGKYSRDVGICCTKRGVQFQGMTKELAGLTFAYDPPRTGLWISCRGWKAEIKQSGSSFIVETK